MKPTELLINTLKEFGYDVVKQGSIPKPTEKAYPDSFFTYWNFETPRSGFYDNKHHRAEHGYWVYFYSCNPNDIDWFLEETIEKVGNRLEEVGFIVTSDGEDVDSGNDTHDGKMIEVYYINEKREELDNE